MTVTANRKQRRQSANQRRNQEREARWRDERYSVPYRTDRPTVTLSLIWFVTILASVMFSQWAVGLVGAVLAGVAGLQTGHTWARYTLSDRRVCAVFAGLMALSGLAGTFGLGVGCVVLVLAAGGYSISGVVQVKPTRAKPNALRDATVSFVGVLIRSSIPAGLAAGSLVALTGRGVGAAIGLILLVSAYETGDYLVGSGSANALEGPIAGIASLAVVGAGLALAQPLPFDGPQAVWFSVLTAACCPLGQILGSAILPRGDAWAPGLRRLDSLLIAGPLWLLLL